MKPDATYVVFKAADGYDVGIPMSKAMLDGTILAYQMNDVPLPAEHGFPVRMIVPGYYGMMNCKWLTEHRAREARPTKDTGRSEAGRTRRATRRAQR